MTKQERTILKGLYAAGYRYIAREPVSSGRGFLVFCDVEIINVSDTEEWKWDTHTEDVDAYFEDAPILINDLFDWIKADDKEAVEISGVLNQRTDDLTVFRKVKTHKQGVQAVNHKIYRGDDNAEKEP